jgi:hypothetical protein
MLRLLQVLQAAGVETLPLKGFALGLTVYPRPEDRFLADLDILVRAASVGPALEILAEAGYRKPHLRATEGFYRDHHFHWLLRNDAENTVELHWNLAKPDDYVRFDVEGFFARSRQIESDGVRFRILSDMDQLLHGASQALGDAFCDLRRVVDAALLVRNGAADDPGVVELARDQGLATPLWLLLGLQRELTGTDPPAGIEPGLQPPALTRRCLHSLELREMKLTGRYGPRQLLRWLCAPDIGAARAEARAYLWPASAHWLAMGREPSDRPRATERACLSLRRAWSMAKLLGYQAWCLAAGRGSPP